MSFSGEVKEELAKNISPARHCQIAELAAILHFCGQYGRDENGLYTIGFQTENQMAIRKCFTLLKKTYNIETGVALTEREMQGVLQKIGSLDEPVSRTLIKNACCRRLFCGELFCARAL